MGSVSMTVYKILTVYLVVAGPCIWTPPQLPLPTTPVPILRYVDTQNIDGSYTYGFEGGDGTYKLETRYKDGRVKGKYGYYDPEGVFREASYGAEAGRGFEPQIEGIELPPPTIVEEIQNEILQNFQPQNSKPPSFENFKASTSEEETKNPRLPEENKIKIVNGRRAVLKKRLRPKATPAPAQFLDPQVLDPQVQRQNNLKAREEQLKTLRNHRQQLLLLQQRQAGERQNSPRSFQTFQENPRSSANGVRDPYLSGVDLNSGSYSYSYGK